MTSAVDRRQILSLYRSLLRRSHALPVDYLRAFFHIKSGDTVRAILETDPKNAPLLKSKLKRAKADLRTLQAACAGDRRAFDRALDEAYGRTGRLRWEIMKPLLADSDAPLPPRIIPAVEKSRPPVYSPELKALLHSTYSRTTKPLNSKSLITPPTMPPRADPTSEDARLLGPLSKRRQVNIHWRFFTQQWKKILPPLEVRVRRIDDDGPASSSTHDVSRAGIRPIGLQGSGVRDQAEAIAGPSYVSKPMTRRERIALGVQELANPSPSPHPVQAKRTLRRAYKRLLGRTPDLTYSYSALPDARPRNTVYSVSLSPSALAASLYSSANRLPDVDPADLAWLQRASTNAAK